MVLLNFTVSTCTLQGQTLLVCLKEALQLSQHPLSYAFSVASGLPGGLQEKQTSFTDRCHGCILKQRLCQDTDADSIEWTPANVAWK